MTSTISLRTLATQINTYSKDNYRIEKSNPAEQTAYLKLQADDSDHNGYIDIQEFRNYYLRTQEIKTLPVEVNDARCAAADLILNATETDDPQAMEHAFDYFVNYDSTLSDIMMHIALDKTQPNIRQFFNAMVLYAQGVSEDDWDSLIYEIESFRTVTTEPAGTIYTLDFLYSAYRHFPTNIPFINPFVQTLRTIMQSPDIYNNQYYMLKALRTLSALDKKACIAPITTYIIEQLGKPQPPYEHLAALLYDTIFGLKDQAIPFVTQLFRLTNDRRFHDILRQMLTELASVYDYAAAEAALADVNSLEVPETTPGSMMRTLESIGGGNNRNLIIEKNIPSEYFTYTLLAAYDTDHDNSISVPEYRSYYVEHTQPQQTRPLFSDSTCLYIQDLYSDTPSTAVIDNGNANEDAGVKLIGHAIPYNEITQQAMKDMLADIALDKKRPGLARLAAVQYLRTYLSFAEAHYNSWQEVLAGIIKELGLQTQDPVAALETGYFMFCEQFTADFIFAPGEGNSAAAYQRYLGFLESIRRSPQISKSPELLKKLNDLVSAVQEYLH